MNIHISPTDKPFYVFVYIFSVIIMFDAVWGDGGMTGLD